ncbi:membrane bound O-acyl transferase family-domain-containing protein [Schizophyllum commune]
MSDGRENNPVAFILPCLGVLVPLPFVIATHPPAAIRAAILAAQVWMAWWVTGTYTISLGDPMMDYAIACFLYSLPLMHCLHFYFFTDALTDGTRHVYDKQAAKDMPFWQRVWWATCLASAVRGVGWNYEIANLPPIPKSRSRSEFFAGALRDMALFLFLADLVDIYVTSNPVMSTRAAEGLSIRTQGFVFQSLTAIFWAINVWSNFQIVYCLAAMLFVGAGWSEPRFWPRMCGSWADAYTVRRTWGRVWHQLFRRFVSCFGKTAARTLGFAPGTFASRYTQLFVGFLASGMIHNWGDRMIGQTFGRSTVFFLAQVVAIMLEDHVIALAREAGVKESKATRALGYVWTVLWFSISVPFLMDVMTDAGRPRSAALPSSPIKTLWWAAGLEGSISIPWPEAGNATMVY